MIEWAMYFLIGAATGALGGIFGIGGGLVAIPVLVLCFDMSQQLAQGTVLVMLVPNVFLSVWRYNQRTRIVLADAIPLALSGLLFAGLASLIAVSVDDQWMRIGFAVFLLTLAAYNYVQLRWARAPLAAKPERWWQWCALGSFSGGLGGFFGVGSSIMATAVLTSIFGVTQVVAQGLALALAVPSTAVTLLTYALHDHVDWNIAVPMAVGGILCVGQGVKLAHALPDRKLRVCFCLFLVFCALSLAFKS